MTESNPYMDPNADVDLWRAPKPQVGNHDLSGAPCSLCGLRHEIDAIDTVPTEVLEGVSEILDDLGPKAERIVVSDRADPAGQLIKDVEHFSTLLDDTNTTGALLRALAEVVDRSSDGEVERRWHFYRCEQALVSTHLLLRVVNWAIDRVAEMNSRYPLAQVAQFDRFVESQRDTLNTRLDLVVDKYRSYAAQYGFPPDEQLVATGEYSSGYTDQYHWADPIISQPMQRRTKKKGPRDLR